MQNAPVEKIDGDIAAIISPHAGYRFAGHVMGAAYKQLKGRNYKRIIILAFSHQYGVFDRISVLPVKEYETPLGPVDVDTRLVENLLKNDEIFTSIPRIHMREHSDENQLPFIKTVLPDTPIVSLLVGDLSSEKMEQAAEILTLLMRENSLFIASTDLNHYGDAYGYAPFGNLKGSELIEKIHSHDREALECMEEVSPGKFRSYLDKTGATVCGKKPVELLLRILKKNDIKEGKTLHYYTSADIEGSGYARQTCGYGSVAFMFPGDRKTPVPAMKQENPEKSSESSSVEEPDPPVLTKSEQMTLLCLARDTLYGITRNRNYIPDISKYEITPSLKEKSRLFVTLNKYGKLRGCIGHVEAREPIWKAVIQNTYNAAFRDPRFPAVKASEVKDMDIEISINSPQRIVKDVKQIEIGKHGLVLEKGWQKGLLLPQVPVELGWNRGQFLDAICRKAGLPKDSWKDKDACLYCFHSQVFHEEKKDSPSEP